MPAVLTIKHYEDIIDNFVDAVTTSDHSYYLFVGKPEPWPNDSSPPAANSDIAEYQLATYHELGFGKKIVANSVSYMIPNYTWANNTLYAQYDPTNPSLYSSNFYVVTNIGGVYKCLNNNNGANSTVQPDLTTTSGVFLTSDGYTWKYMYTIGSTTNTEFTSNNYIPVFANAQVSGNAVSGTIDIARMVSGGNNWQAYANGYIVATIDPQTFQLPTTLSGYDDFYTGSSLYLKNGFGGGQISQIVYYNGLAKQATVNPAFVTYAYLGLSNISGTIIPGLIAAQAIQSINFVSASGTFNVGDTIIQTDVGTVATIVTANSTTMQAVTSTVSGFSLNYPFYDTTQASTVQTGKVNIVSGNSWVFANGSTAFTTDYAIGNYIQVGETANNNVRLITGVNSTVIICSNAFSYTMTTANNYLVPVAAVPTSCTALLANGVATGINTSGVTLTISNAAISSLLYIIGESVNMVNSANVNQGANGIVSYANTSTVLLSSVQGSFTTSLFLLGSSSLQKATISVVKSTPSVIVDNPVGTFIAGQGISFLNPANTQLVVANATLSSFYYAPNELTEFVISPTVTITGDGTNALAFSTVNATTNSISSVVMLNAGMNYTNAAIAITSNTLYGNGASCTPVIAPLLGHGYNPIEELGSKYVGISVTLDTIENESYKFPGYGSYRILGILEDPLFADLTVTLNDIDHSKLTINNLVSGFEQGEIVIQPVTNAAGIVVYSNSSFLELQHVRGTFSNVGANSGLYGLTSTSTANVLTANVSYFHIVGSSLESVSEFHSNASADIVLLVSNTELQLTNVAGVFAPNDTLIDSTTNSYGNVVTLLAANGTTDVSSVFGLRFNQTARIPLISSSGTFQQFEYVTQQITNAQGKIVDATHELDLTYNTLSGGSFVVGSQILASSGNGIITFANSTYLRLTCVEGTISAAINSGSVSANVTNTYSVLVLGDVSGNKFQPVYTVQGQNSGAMGVPVNFANSIFFPDLVKNSGEVAYLTYVAPFTLSNTSVENIRLVIGF